MIEQLCAKANARALTSVEPGSWECLNLVIPANLGKKEEEEKRKERHAFCDGLNEGFHNKARKTLTRHVYFLTSMAGGFQYTNAANQGATSTESEQHNLYQPSRTNR
ncbi:Hypothetical predicted protein [Podarcis lilfordi]|uniref:Uncharacterized protein n=1 Tax=Podarcis lilfordi TaxID=74358 RepID=A0AA35KD17_9SAUR|nr:Hypothetical predicted protein [Podarcis lilfordi]